MVNQDQDLWRLKQAGGFGTRTDAGNGYLRAQPHLVSVLMHGIGAAPYP